MNEIADAIRHQRSETEARIRDLEVQLEAFRRGWYRGAFGRFWYRPAGQPGDPDVEIRTDNPAQLDARLTDNAIVDAIRLGWYVEKSKGEWIDARWASRPDEDYRVYCYSPSFPGLKFAWTQEYEGRGYTVEHFVATEHEAVRRALAAWLTDNERPGGSNDGPKEDGGPGESGG